MFSFLFSLCSCRGVQLSNSQAGDVLAVMGMEITKDAFVQLITENASRSPTHFSREIMGIDVTQTEIYQKFQNVELCK